MKLNNKLLKFFALTASLACASSSFGLIVSVSGDGEQIAPPASTAPGQTEKNLQQGFNEVQGLLLASDLTIDGGLIAAGTWISSHMIFLDSIGEEGIRTDAIWKFDGTILGLLTDANEYNSSSLLGALGTTYPVSGTERGLEIGGDSVSISGDELTLGMRVTTPGDWVRVVTAYAPNSNAVPDAGSTGAMLLGVFLITLAGRRKFSSKA